MGFTTPCFIRKNTPELRRELEELGYEILNFGNTTLDAHNYDGNGRFPRLVFVLRRFKEMENGVVLLRLWQVPMGMDILLPVLTVYMILWNKL